MNYEGRSDSVPTQLLDQTNNLGSLGSQRVTDLPSSLLRIDTGHGVHLLVQKTPTGIGKHI